MKLLLSFWVFAIAGFFAPAAVAGQQINDMEWGQKARPCGAGASEPTQGDQTMFTMDMPDATVAQMQQMIMVAQAAVPKAATQVEKTMLVGGLCMGQRK